MTDFTLSSGSICRPYRSPWGAFPTRGVRTESTSAAIAVGQPVTLGTAGSTTYDCAIAVAGNAPNMFNTIGIAAEAEAAGGSSAVAGATISVWEANPLVEFKAVTKGGVLASSLVGLRRSLVWDSTLGIAWVDLSASTATDWRVLVTQNLDAVGDSGGYVAFRFLSQTGSQINSTILSSSPLLAFYS